MAVDGPPIRREQFASTTTAARTSAFLWYMYFPNERISLRVLFPDWIEKRRAGTIRLIQTCHRVLRSLFLSDGFQGRLS
jgi:hypothetical protein